MELGLGMVHVLAVAHVAIYSYTYTHLLQFSECFIRELLITLFLAI